MYEISTITMNTKLPYKNVELNLYNIFKYIEIDDIVNGMKYNGNIKGIYKTRLNNTTKSFYNQINMIIYYNKCINVKLFGNGSLHLTGCKQVSDGENVTKIIMGILDNLDSKYSSILVVRDKNGVLLDNENNIYSKKYNRILGYVKDNVYHIHRKEYIIDNKYMYYLRCKNITENRTTRLLNFDGDDIGSVHIKLVNNKKKFYKNSNIKYDYDKCVVLYKDLLLGFIEYNINIDETDIPEEKLVYEIDYKCNAYIVKQDHIKDYDINVNSINIWFDIGYKIDRNKLYKSLLDKMYICKYNPESYCGINLTYKYNINKDGFCKCVNKCTCTNITFLIFHSGKIISTGYKNMDDIDTIYKRIIKLFDIQKEFIKS